MQGLDIKQDKALVEVEVKKQMIEERVKTLVIDDESQLNETVNITRVIATIKKTVEERRKFFVKPLNDQVKKINTFFKEMLTPIEKADRVLRERIVKYKQKKDEELRKAEEERRRQQEEKAKEDMENKGIAFKEDDLQLDIVIPEGTKSILPENTKTRKLWKFKIIDEAKVPREYLKIDEVKINQAIHQGVREIEGVEIYQEEILVV